MAESPGYSVSSVTLRIMSVILGVMVCLLGASRVEAEDSSEHAEWQKRVVLSAGQEVQGDYFAFGPHVEISGTVHGDVYAAGGEVLVDGVVDGDLIVAGGEVRVSGEITQDVRLAGGTVTLSGKIHRNATIAGGDLHLTDSSHLKGNAVIGAGNVTLSKAIGGDLAVAAPAIRLTSRASVGKNVIYWSDDEPSIDEGATVLGTVTRRPIPEVFKGEEAKRGLAGMKLVGGMVSFASTLLLGLLLLRIYPVFTSRVASKIQEQPWVVLGVGGALLFGVPMLIVVCMVSVLGIPIGLMLGAMYVVTLYLGRVFVLLWLGQRLLRLVSDSSSAIKAFVTGLVTYFILALVPLIGGMITMLTIAIGFGAILMTKKELVVRLREQQLV